MLRRPCAKQCGAAGPQVLESLLITADGDFLPLALMSSRSSGAADVLSCSFSFSCSPSAPQTDNQANYRWLVFGWLVVLLHKDRRKVRSRLPMSSQGTEEAPRLWNGSSVFPVLGFNSESVHARREQSTVWPSQVPTRQPPHPQQPLATSSSSMSTLLNTLALINPPAWNKLGCFYPCQDVTFNKQLSAASASLCHCDRPALIIFHIIMSI